VLTRPLRTLRVNNNKPKLREDLLVRDLDPRWEEESEEEVEDEELMNEWLFK